MTKHLPVLAVAVLIVSWSAETQVRLQAETVCDVTPPNGVVADLEASLIRDLFGVSPLPEHLRRLHSYGNRLLSVGPFGLGQNGITTGRPDPSIAAGWIRAKFSWMRAAKGPLRITGHRIDGDAPPLQARIPEGYGEIGFQPSGLMFSTPGCWHIAAQIGDLTDSHLTFVTNIVKAAEGPALWRKSSIEDLQILRSPH